MMKSKMVLVIVGFMVMGICAAYVLQESQAYVATNNAIVMPAESTNPVVPNSPGESPVSPAASRDVVQSPVSPAASSKPVVSPVSPASPTAEIVDPETPSLVE